MAAPKTGSRRIVVDDIAYRWRIRRRATVMQADYGCGKLHVSVELFRRPGAVLVLHTDRPHPADWGTGEVVPVCPVDIAEWVRLAVQAGWAPAVPGPQFACTCGGDRNASFFLRRTDRPSILDARQAPL
jgi:hypothetical protein